MVPSPLSVKTYECSPSALRVFLIVWPIADLLPALKGEICHSFYHDMPVNFTTYVSFFFPINGSSHEGDEAIYSLQGRKMSWELGATF